MKALIGKYVFKIMIMLIKAAGNCLAAFLLKERGNIIMSTTNTTVKSTTTTILTNAAAIVLAYLANKASDNSTAWATYRNALIQSSANSILSALTTTTAATSSNATASNTDSTAK
ncbi:hypothetical protein [Pectinatus frisingensis]|uniref:hypothetical protein n=1 Tax=Pectinatus frisingensis TaxID=865 RepID=UPI0018C76BD2|nr:hypothetical protein [Pectinatus frisingensis]